MTLRVSLACLTIGLSAVCFPSAAIAQSLSKPEAVMAETAKREAPEGIALLEKIVNINSGTMNTAGVTAIKDTLDPQFKALGFTTKTVDMSAIKRGPTLVAEHPCPAGTGHCGKRILLLGHMDTVFEKDSPFQKYSIVPNTDGKIATGPGVADEKGGLVVMIYALRAMQAAGVLKDTEITAVLDGDEENGGRPREISRASLIEAAKRSDVALEFETTMVVDGVDYGSTSRRGGGGWHVEATGKTGHSSQVFSPAMGYGAIYELARILDAFRTQLPEKSLTYNTSLIAGGTSIVQDKTNASPAYTAVGKGNVIPPIAIAEGDLRAISPEQQERTAAKMKAIVAQHLPGTSATITITGFGSPMPPTPGNQALLRMLNGVNTSLGTPQMPELDPLLRGGGDVSEIAQYVDALAGTGAAGAGLHAEGETIELNKQSVETERYAVLMYRLSKVEPTKKLVDVFPAK
jgi:glutamate carboxypeptidase